MSLNIAHGLEQKSESRSMIIGTPLVLVALFCFGLAMMHPVASGDAKSASTSNISSSDKKSLDASTSSVYELKPLPLAHTSSNTLTSSASASSDSSIGNSTDTPQSSDSGGSGNSNNGTLSGSGHGTSSIINDMSSASKLPVASSSKHGNYLITNVGHGLLDNL